MIKDNQRYFNRLHVVMDGLLIVASYFLAWLVRFQSHLLRPDENVGALPLQVYLGILYFLVPVYLFIYYQLGLYTSKRVSKMTGEMYNIMKANTIGLILFFTMQTVLQIDNVSRGMVFLFYGINTILEIVYRYLIRKVLRTFRKKGYNLKHILLVGYSKSAEEYVDRILLNPQWGYVVHGFLDNRVPQGTTYRGIKVLGQIENLPVILPLKDLDEVTVTLPQEESNRMEEIVSICEKFGIHTKLIPDYANIIPGKPYMEDIMGLPVINIRHVPLTNTWNIVVKRSMDILVSLLGIIISSPLLLVSAVAVKLSSPGPVIYKQERVGLHGKCFMMYKFRSMEIQTEEKEKEGWTVKNDPRVTKVGKIIRKTSIDELPQLVNVLKGEMSMVGPRPERPQYVERFQEEIPRYMVKHQVRPGITGWAQINGYRGNTSIRRRIEHDLFYIENWTVGMDIKIMFLTIFKGFINKNAY